MKDRYMIQRVIVKGSLHSQLKIPAVRFKFSAECLVIQILKILQPPPPLGQDDHYDKEWTEERSRGVGGVYKVMPPNKLSVRVMNVRLLMIAILSHA